MDCRRVVGPALLLGLVVPLLAAPAGAVQHHFFTITVVNKVSGQPIPGIKLTTTNSIVFSTDANGKVPFYEPGLMGTSVWFSLGSCSIPQGQTQGTCVDGSGGATTCTSHADCNLGYSPPTGFLGIVGIGFTANEQGTAQIRVCPAGGGCTPDGVVGTSGPAPTPNPNQMFKLTVADQATGRGVPLLQVQTSTQTYVTDSGGVVAFYDAARMGTTVHFDVSGHGYGTAGADLVATAGGSGSVSIARVNLAERMYRVTGGGIYRDTVALEQTAPLQLPVLNSQVFGQDSVLTTIYQGKVFWIWGDTNKPSFPLGMFRAPGATSLLPAQGGLDPSVGVNLTYFGDGTGFVAAMCPPAGVPPPPGYENASLRCWMGSLVAVPNAQNVERLLAVYSLGQGFTEVKRGWARFNDSLKYFEEQVVFNGSEKLALSAHPYKVTHGATTYVYGTAQGTVSVSGPFDLHPTDNPVRTVATETAVLNPAGYEAFTPFQQGSDTVLDLNPDGTLHYTWKTNTRPLTGTSSVDPTVPADQKLYGHVADPNSGAAPLLASSSTDWNAYRKRYVQIFMQTFGSPSFGGELWFMEADTPLGPWAYARKVITHNNYTMYNPRHHAFFNKQGGKEIYFEGTYTLFLTSNQTATPRYNYNQMMYRLLLDNAGVALPVPVYDLTAAAVPGTFVTKKGLRPSTPDGTAAFMAPDRAGMTGTVPVWWNNASCQPHQLVAGGTPTTEPIFWALPANTANPPASTVPLYEYVNATTGDRAYSTNPALVLAGYVRSTDPLVLVWANPVKVPLPVHDYLATLIADAGADQCTLEHSPGAGASVTLSASGSVVPSGVTASYAWTFPGGTATGAAPTVTLPAGIDLVTLTVSGSDGQSSTDSVVVNVAACPSGCC